MTTITGTLLDNSGAPVANRRVRASLRAVSVLTESGEIIRDTATFSAADGTWSLTLTPTSHLAFPDGATYRISAAGHVWYITVPVSGTHDIIDVIVEPAVAPNNLSVAKTEFDALSALSTRPFRLMTYYGIPENVNSRFDREYAAQLFAGFDYVIFGEGLQFDAHQYHDSTADIIGRMRAYNPNVMIFGYINIAVSVGNEPLEDLEEKMDFWAAFEGNPTVGVDGIFFDLCGYDFEVPRARFNHLADYAHSLGKPVLYNVFDWDDTFANEVEATYNPDGLPTSATSMDYALLESHVVNSSAYSARNGYNFVANIVSRAEQAASYRDSLGITPLSLNAIDYSANTDQQIQEWFDACQVVCQMYSFPFGVNALDYSSIAPNQNVVYNHYYDPNWRIRYNPDIIPYFDALDDILREDAGMALHAPDAGPWTWRGPIAVRADSASFYPKVQGWIVVPPAGERIFVTTLPFDGGFLGTVTTGDLFIYPDTHSSAGEIYRWNGSSWDFVTILTPPHSTTDAAIFHVAAA